MNGSVIAGKPSQRQRPGASPERVIFLPARAFVPPARVRELVRAYGGAGFSGTRHGLSPEAVAGIAGAAALLDDAAR